MSKVLTQHLLFHILFLLVLFSLAFVFYFMPFCNTVEFRRKSVLCYSEKHEISKTNVHKWLVLYTHCLVIVWIPLSDIGLETFQNTSCILIIPLILQDQHSIKENIAINVYILHVFICTPYFTPRDIAKFPSTLYHFAQFS